MSPPCHSKNLIFVGMSAKFSVVVVVLCIVGCLFELVLELVLVV